VKVRDRKLTFLKVGVSIFLIYHLLAMTILPMGSGLLIRELGRYFAPYANLLQMNTTWQFFSPGPSPIFYLEYSFLELDSNGEETETEPRLLPERRQTFGYSDSYNRRLFSMRFFSLNQQRLEQYLVPWLCKQNPKAIQVTVRQMFGEINSVERIRSDTDLQNFSQMSQPLNFPRSTYSCKSEEGV
jgi:hypothetical protein